MTEQLKIKITAEIADFKKNVKEAMEETKKVGSVAQSVGDKIKKTFADMGKSVKDGLSKGVEVGKKALGKLSIAFGLVTKGTEEYRNNQAKLLTTFETAGASAEAATNTYNDLYRVLGESDVAVEAANHLAQMTTNQKELSEWTNICQGVYATFGDSLPIEGLTEAANETAKVGTVTGSLADALNWAGISEDAFNESLAKCNTEAERERLIRETLNGLYDEASTKFAENNEQIMKQRDAQASLQANLAKVGEALTPLLTLFTQFASEALALVLPYITSLAETYVPMLQAGFEKIPEVVASIVEKINEFKSGLEEAQQWMKENEDTVTALSIALGLLTAALVLYNIESIIKKANDIAETVALYGLIAAEYAQVAATNAVAFASKVAGAAIGFLTSPITLAIAGFGALIAACVLVVKNWDSITAAASKLWQGISNAFNKIKSTISEKINGAKDAVKGAIDKIKGFFDFKFEWPKVPMPKFSISPSGWKVGDLLKGSIPKLSIKWNALGGVFDKKTVFGYGGSLQGIGENGAEAVVPLEKNTKWLDKMAAMLADKMGTNRDIILQIDGKTFAQVTEDSLNSLTRQRGYLGLNII
jgi:phage-related protein